MNRLYLIPIVYLTIVSSVLLLPVSASGESPTWIAAADKPPHLQGVIKTCESTLQPPEKGCVFWKAQPGAVHPGGYLIVSDAFEDQLTVTTRVIPHAAEGKQKIWLAALGFTPGEQPTVLSLTFAGTASAFFGLHGHLRLESSAGLLPETLKPETTASLKYCNLQHVFLMPGKPYNATLSYDSRTGLTSVELTDIAKGKTIYSGHLWLRPADHTLYGGAGGMQIDGKADEWALELADMSVKAEAVRIGMPVALQNNIDFTVYPCTGASLDETGRRGSCNEHRRAYTNQTLCADIKGIGSGLPGGFRITAVGTGNTAISLWKGTPAGLCSMPVVLGRLPTGRYRVVLEYVGKNYQAHVAEEEITIYSARIHAKVTAPENRPTETGEKLAGEIKLEADRNVGELGVRLLAAPETGVARKQVIWEKTLTLSGDEPEEYSFSFTPEHMNIPYIFSLEYDYPELIEWVCEYEIPRSFYVSPNGDDNWAGYLPAPQPETGEEHGPFRTIEGAKKTIRSLKKNAMLQGPVTVYIREGTYYLNDTLVFTPDDAGTSTATITYAAYPGETPMISGGRQITEWEQLKGNVWSAPLSGLMNRKGDLHILRDGDNWAIRARYPNLDPDEPVTGGWLFAQAPDGTGKQVYDRIIVRAGDFPAWDDWNRAQVHIFPAWGWVNAIVDVTGVDREKHTIFVESEQDIRPGNRFFITGLAAALDSPGEWCLDLNTQTMLYWPQDPGFPEVEVVAPVLEKLIEIRGNGDKFVEYLNFRGLTFIDTDYTAPGGYYTPADAAIWMTRARNILIENCTFTNLGGYAVRLEQKSQYNRIINNEMSHLGQGGVIMLGNATDQPHDNVVTANNMHHLGRVYKHVAGVYVTTGSNNRITHNRISHVPRYGISLKSYSTSSYSHNNIVEYNELIDTNLETNDTGAIETLGRDKQDSGNTIRFNLIRNVVGLKTTETGEFLSPHFTWGIYLDDYSSGTTVYGNIVYNTVLGGICIHGGKNNTIENNIFVEGKQHQIRLQPRDEFMKGNIFRHNIVVYSVPDADLWYSYSHTWHRKRLAEADFNLYWHTGGVDLAETDQSITPEGNLTSWRESGFDKHSIIADPLFVNPQQGDFSLKPQSPAFDLGFKQIPVEQIGPRGFTRKQE